MPPVLSIAFNGWMAGMLKKPEKLAKTKPNVTSPGTTIRRCGIKGKK
jgi:hypothetical protein